MRQYFLIILFSSFFLISNSVEANQHNPEVEYITDNTLILKFNYVDAQFSSDKYQSIIYPLIENQTNIVYDRFFTNYTIHYDWRSNLDSDKMILKVNPIITFNSTLNPIMIGVLQNTLILENKQILKSYFDVPITWTLKMSWGDITIEN